jgi:hypothetical protein
MKLIDLADSLDPFMDLQGEVFLQILIDGEDAPQQLPLDTPWGQNIVCKKLAEVNSDSRPTDHQVKIATQIIKGVAFEKPRRAANRAVAHLISQRPLAQAVIAIAKAGGARCDATRLLPKLNKMATRERIDTTKGRLPWPRNEDSLGSQLRDIMELVAAIGGRLEYDKDSRPREWVIHPLDASDEGAKEVTVLSPHPTSASVEAGTSPAADSMADSEPGAVVSDGRFAELVKDIL